MGTMSWKGPCAHRLPAVRLIAAGACAGEQLRHLGHEGGDGLHGLMLSSQLQQQLGRTGCVQLLASRQARGCAGEVAQQRMRRLAHGRELVQRACQLQPASKLRRQTRCSAHGGDGSCQHVQAAGQVLMQRVAARCAHGWLQVLRPSWHRQRLARLEPEPATMLDGADWH